MPLEIPLLQAGPRKAQVWRSHSGNRIWRVTWVPGPWVLVYCPCLQGRDDQIHFSGEEIEAQGVRAADAGSCSLAVTGSGFDPKPLAAKHTTIPRWTTPHSRALPRGCRSAMGNCLGEQATCSPTDPSWDSPKAPSDGRASRTHVPENRHAKHQHFEKLLCTIPSRRQSWSSLPRAESNELYFNRDVRVSLSYFIKQLWNG